MHTGLKLATQMRWKAPNRLLFVIADAPCHGRAYHDESMKDNYPDGKPGFDNDPTVFIRELQRKKVQVVFLQIKKSTDKMVGILKAAYDAEPVSQGSLQRKLLYVPIDQKIAIDPQQLADVISRTVTDTVVASVRETLGV